MNKRIVLFLLRRVLFDVLCVYVFMMSAGTWISRKGFITICAIHSELNDFLFFETVYTQKYCVVLCSFYVVLRFVHVELRFVHVVLCSVCCIMLRFVYCSCCVVFVHVVLCCVLFVALCCDLCIVEVFHSYIFKFALIWPWRVATSISDLLTIISSCWLL